MASEMGIRNGQRIDASFGYCFFLNVFAFRCGCKIWHLGWRATVSVRMM